MVNTKDFKPASKVILILLAGFFVLSACGKNDLALYADQYEDLQGRFHFEYPSSWGLIPEKDLKGRNEKFIVGVSRQESPGTAVGVIIEKAPEGKTFDFQYELFLEKIESDLRSLPDYKRIRAKQMRQNGIPVIGIEYTQKHLDQAFVRQKQLIFITPEAIYYLSGSALTDNYDRYEKELDFIFDSFQVTAL